MPRIAHLTLLLFIFVTVCEALALFVTDEEDSSFLEDILVVVDADTLLLL